MDKTAIFHIEGGIGKHVASTAVVECFKKANPSTLITVVCAWPEVFLNNPNVDRVYMIGKTPHFYRDHIYQKDTQIFAQEPYKQTSHILQSKSLIDTWCDMIGVEYNGETPSIYFNFREAEMGDKLFTTPTDKPVLIFQPFGGPGKEHQDTPYSWTRDIHPRIAQDLVDKLSEKYYIIHICYDSHPQLQNVLRIDQQLQKKVLFSALKYADARLLIDSSLQHAAAAMNLPSTVVWVATSQTVFGYSIHRNVNPKTTFLQGTVDSYLYDYNFTGPILECPYSSPYEIFDVQAIANTLL